MFAIKHAKAKIVSFSFHLLCLIGYAVVGPVEEEIPNLLGNPVKSQPVPLRTWTSLSLVLKPYLR